MTVEEFLEECKGLKDLPWSKEGILRTEEGRWLCPITALLEKKTGKLFGVHLAISMGVTHLGLTYEDARKIIMGADFRGGTLHTELREALGVKESPPSPSV